MTGFDAIGLNNRQVYNLTAGLLVAGATCAGYDPEMSDTRVLAGFRKCFLDVPAVARQRLLDDPPIACIVLCAIPGDRAALAIEAVRRGEDVMVDKPGVTTETQLEAVEAAVRETGQLCSFALGSKPNQAQGIAKFLRFKPVSLAGATDNHGNPRKRVS